MVLRPHPSSYRDPAGFIFYHKQTLFRQVNQVFRADYELLMSSGLYQALVRRQQLIPHKEIAANLTGTNLWYKTLQPEALSYISYPYEWCFDMLKDAALLTLEIARQAMNHGMMLKDASAYNLQWHHGKMTFIDTLSFETYDSTEPWIAYRQFCEHFYAPLALMHFLKAPLQSLLLAYPEGIPLQLARQMLPWKSRWHLHTYLHLHLHGRVSQKSIENKTAPFTAKKMENLLRSLEEGIRSFSFSQPSGVWSGYYEEAGQREDYLESKKTIVQKWASQLDVDSVFDAGANEGSFSMLWSDKAQQIICADLDHYAINKLYGELKSAQHTSLHPLILDLAHPSPAIGVSNTERPSFLERTQTDLVMALALIHHLAIGHNIPFSNIATMFAGIGPYLMIEFVPKDDPKIQLMLTQKKDVYDWYTEHAFIVSFREVYEIREQVAVGQSGRTLYLMQKKHGH